MTTFQEIYTPKIDEILDTLHDIKWSNGMVKIITPRYAVDGRVVGYIVVAEFYDN